MAFRTTRWVLRYRPGQRVVHWIHAAAFFVLFITGLALIWPPLSFLAAGGLSRILHRVAAVVFLLTPVLYALIDFRGLRDLVRDSFTYTREDLEWLKGFPGISWAGPPICPPRGGSTRGRKSTTPSPLSLTSRSRGLGLCCGLARDPSDLLAC